MPTLAEIDALGDVLDELTRMSVVDLNELWRRIQDMTPEEAADYLQDAFPEVVTPYIATAADLTAIWYDDLVPESDFLADPADPPEMQALQSTARWAVAPMFGQSDVSPLERMTVGAQRTVYNGSRFTIELNAEAEGVRWARHARPGACSFCKMLATRGAVYTSREAAAQVVGRGKEMSLSDRRARAAGNDRVGGRFIAGGVKTRGSQAGGSSFHDHCHCRPVPIREGSPYSLPDYVRRWEQEYIAASRAVRNDNGVIDTKAVLAYMRANET